MLCVDRTNVPMAPVAGKRVSTPESAAPDGGLESWPRKKAKSFGSFGWGAGDKFDDLLAAQGVIETPVPGQGTIEIDEEDSWEKKFQNWFRFGTPQYPDGGAQLNGAVRDAGSARSGQHISGSSSGLQTDGHGQQPHGLITLADLEEEEMLVDDVDIDAALQELSDLDVKAAPVWPPPARNMALPRPPRFGLTCCVAPRKETLTCCVAPRQKAKPAKRTATGMGAQRPLFKGAQKPAPKVAAPKQGLVWKPMFSPGSG